MADSRTGSRCRLLERVERGSLYQRSVRPAIPRKCALVAAILPLLRPTDAFALCAATVLLERTRRDLDRIGRRLGATEVVRAVTWRFLQLLRTWLGEIERATKKLTVGDLPAEGRRALA